MYRAAGSDHTQTCVYMIIFLFGLASLTACFSNQHWQLRQLKTHVTEEARIDCIYFQFPISIVGLYIHESWSFVMGNKENSCNAISWKQNYMVCKLAMRSISLIQSDNLNSTQQLMIIFNGSTIRIRLSINFCYIRM